MRSGHSDPRPVQARPQTGAKQGAERAITRDKVADLRATEVGAADVERRKAEQSQLQSSATVLLSFSKFHQLVLYEETCLAKWP